MFVHMWKDMAVPAVILDFSLFPGGSVLFVFVLVTVVAHAFTEALHKLNLFLDHHKTFTFPRAWNSAYKRGKGWPYNCTR